jgi:hypothetical protein
VKMQACLQVTFLLDLEKVTTQVSGFRVQGSADVSGLNSGIWNPDTRLSPCEPLAEIARDRNPRLAGPCRLWHIPSVRMDRGGP